MNIGAVPALERDTVDAATQLPPRGADAADGDTQGGADATAGAGPGREMRTSRG